MTVNIRVFSSHRKEASIFLRMVEELSRAYHSCIRLTPPPRSRRSIGWLKISAEEVEYRRTSTLGPRKYMTYEYSEYVYKSE